MLLGQSCEFRMLQLFLGGEAACGVIITITSHALIRHIQIKEIFWMNKSLDKLLWYIILFGFTNLIGLTWLTHLIWSSTCLIFSAFFSCVHSSPDGSPRPKAFVKEWIDQSWVRDAQTKKSNVERGDEPTPKKCKGMMMDDVYFACFFEPADLWMSRIHLYFRVSAFPGCGNVLPCTAFCCVNMGRPESSTDRAWRRLVACGHGTCNFFTNQYPLLKYLGSWVSLKMRYCT